MRWWKKGVAGWRFAVTRVWRKLFNLFGSGSVLGTCSCECCASKESIMSSSGEAAPVPEEDVKLYTIHVGILGLTDTRHWQS